jgi:hypothetical protein
MDDETPDGYEWRNIRVRRETRVDATGWREFVFLSADMREVAIAVLVPKGQSATKRVAKKSRHGIR